MSIIKTDDKTNYFELIRRIKGGSFIRHDVDHDIDHALRFAEEEWNNGIHSTYFLLPTAMYFDYSNHFASKIRRFGAYGHDVGFHNNVITQWLDNKEIPIQTLLNAPLSFLRNVAGVEVKGTSSHGDPLCRQKNYQNFQVWDECPKEFNNHLGFETVSLEDFGLEYETYFMRQGAYVSESGRQWQGYFCKKPGQFEPFNDIGIDKIRAIIEKFNQSRTGLLQVLTHPCWWKVNGNAGKTK